MLSWFSKKKKENEEVVAGDALAHGDWSFIQTDIHSHFIPGIDDGAQTIEDSLIMIRAMKEMGFKSLITTPHVKFDHYPNTTETIQNGLAQLHRALADNHIDMQVKTAAEYFIDDHFMQLLESEQLLTIQKNEVLAELSFMIEPLNFLNTIFRIQMKGYRLILAHPERYAFYHDKKEMYEQLKDRGVLFQLNTIALTGYYGKPVKEIAEYLLANRFYDYCGSDMHHMRHAEQLKKVLTLKTMDTLKHYPFKNAKLQVG